VNVRQLNAELVRCGAFQTDITRVSWHTSHTNASHTRGRFIALFLVVQLTACGADWSKDFKK